MKFAGKSLLPIGITRTEGQFDKGDTVNIVGESGETIGMGVTNYNSDDLSRIKRLRSTEIFVATIDHEQVRRERQNFDPSGHYSRPDVTQLTVNRERQSTIKIID